MKNLLMLLFLASAGCLLSPVAEAGSPACPAATPGAVAVIQPLDVPVVYDQSHTAREITAYGSDGFTGGITRGLTVSNFTGGLSLDYRTLEVPGGFCLEMKSVTATLGYDAINVYIERDYPYGSCQFNAVLEHEDNHVRIARETFAEYLPSYQSSLQRAVQSPEFPIYVASKEAGAQMIRDFFKQVMDTSTAEMVARRDTLNNALDSPGSYAYTQNECPRW